ncbi:MAG: beta strand repeat-containing protein [Panacagrimonas sp.]
MAKEVSGRGVVVEGVEATGLDELLKKKLAEVAEDAAAAEEVAAEEVAAEEVVAEDVAEEAFVEGAEAEVAAAGVAAADYATASYSLLGAEAAGPAGWGAAPWLIGGAAVVGGVAIAAASDDDSNNETIVIDNDGDGNINDPDPNVNNAPVITVEQGSTPSIAEGNTVVSGVTVADPEGDPVTTTLSGADAALFSLVNGALVFNTAPDHETPASANGDNVYEVTIEANDGELTTTQGVTVTVTNVSGIPGEEDPNDPGSAGADAFQLTDNIQPDNVDLQGGDDTFNASVGDLNDQDQLDGGDGNDVLNVVMSGGEDEKPTITSVETINVESIGGVANNLNLDNVNGTTTINVVDQGDNSADLNVNALVNDSTRVNLTGDQTITLSVRNSDGDNAVDTGVDAFTGTLALGNSIETVGIEANGDSTFDLVDNGGDLDQVNVTGGANVDITTFASTTYDLSAATGDNSLTFANPGKDAVTVLFGSGDDIGIFGTTLELKGTPPDVFDGGAGLDIFHADVANVDVEPVISNTEVISLSFLEGQNGNFDASLVTNSPDGQIYRIRESAGYVNVNDITDGANIEIVEDILNGGLGSTFDFVSGSNATTTISLVTESNEDPDITHTGDVEVNDVQNLTVAVNGQGEVVIDGSIALDDGETTVLTVSTDSEDDDDIDNDGDLLITGDNEGEGGVGITQAAALEELNIFAINGNIRITDDEAGIDGESDTGNTVIAEAGSLERINLVADNALLSLGDIGDGEGEGSGNDSAAFNLDSVNITGLNRGLFNLDDIFAGDRDVFSSESGSDRFSTLGLDDIFFTDEGAFIEEFTVTTAERSETSPNFFQDGEAGPDEDDNDEQGVNEIDDIVASVIEDLEVNAALDGGVEIRDFYTSLDNVTVFGAGDVELENNDSDTETGILDAEADEDGTLNGRLPYYNQNLALYYVSEINATAHTGDIELDFRIFNGEDSETSENQGFDNAEFVDANIFLGDQDTKEDGVRFDMYGIGPNAWGNANVHVVAGDGDHLPTSADEGNPLLGLRLDGFGYGIITGTGDDSITTGAGMTAAYGGVGDDVISVGMGSDTARGGYGQDTIDLGGDGEGDGATDVVQLVGGFFDDGEGETANSDTGESLGVDFDRILQFEAGSGTDVAELWNFGLDGLGGPDVPFEGIVAIRQENIGDQDSVIDLLPDFVDTGFSEIVEFIGLNLNLDLSSTSDNELIELDFSQNFVGDVLLDGGIFDNGYAGFFAITYDAEGDDAALFLIDSLSPTNVGNIFELNEDDVELVAIFEGVAEGEFQTGDLVFEQAIYPG